MDGRSIYELCDYNVPYEITLADAINRGMLVPFRYYGIFDDTDYSRVPLIRGAFREKDLDEAYLGNARRNELVFRQYQKFCVQYGLRRALGFCCSVAHARSMAEEFSARGVPSAAVYSAPGGRYKESRERAIQRLEAGEIRVIFSVDMFNEGVDIPSVDTVMFLRPTESPVVFMQQLGRGLRKAEGKKFLTVLDFIGNYENAGRVRFFLAKSLGTYGLAVNQTNAKALLPMDCNMVFDLQLLDLFAQMDRNQKRLRDAIHDEYERIRELLGHRPSRIELFTYMDDGVYEKTIGNTKENIFKHYLDFLNGIGALTADQYDESVQDAGTDGISGWKLSAGAGGPGTAAAQLETVL